MSFVLVKPVVPANRTAVPPTGAMPEAQLAPVLQLIGRAAAAARPTVPCLDGHVDRVAAGGKARRSATRLGLSTDKLATEPPSVPLKSISGYVPGVVSWLVPLVP